MGNTERIDDKLYIQHIVMLSLMHTSKINEALELGLGILSQLGEGISRNSAEDDFVEQRKRTQTMIVGVTEDDILSYGPMIDKRKQAAMKFLASLYVCSIYAAEPSLHGLVVLKMVQLTITHGKYTVRWDDAMQSFCASCSFFSPPIIRHIKPVASRPCFVWCSAVRRLR
jgi:hypothetical protein